jgi:benzoyl-CoA reductase/2-hydroxyglutaryl-CoA dehydratase subunit BcrC/BadD/HgdB
MNKLMNLAADMDDLLLETQNELIKKAIDSGRIPLGYTCSFVPIALLSVDGFFPVRLRAPGINGTEIGDAYLSSVICTYTRSILEFAMDGRYDFLGGWVFTANCDHMRRLIDNLEYLRKPSFSHTLDVPHRSGGAADHFFIDEIKTLASKLQEHFGVDTGTASLKKAICQHNQRIIALKAISDLRKNEIPLITGGEFHRLMLASAVTPWDLFEEYLDKFRENIFAREGIGKYRARVAVVGSELDDPNFIDLIESTGGLVVADRFCGGSIPDLTPISEEGDPLEAISLHTLNTVSCPRMMEDFDRRLAAIISARKEYHADGIILETIKFCDTWGVESSTLISELRKSEIPVLRLEREYRLSGEGQMSTRVQAFLESMGK